MSTDKNNAVAAINWDKPTNTAGLEAMGRSILPQIQAALPSFMAKNADRCIRCLLTECARTPKLLDCSPRSLLGGVIMAAQLGLELGGPLGQAYLIPFKGQAAFIPGYKGYITLAIRSGMVRRITPETVRKKDVFRIVRGTEQKLVHDPDPAYDSEPVGYYAVIELTNGGVDFEYMTKAQAERHRDRYAIFKTGPWTTDFDAMAEKTCIRMLGKRMPLSVEWNTAIGLETEVEVGEDQRLGTLIVGAEPDKADSLRDRMDAAKKPANSTGDGPDAPEVPDGVLYGSQSAQNIDAMR